MIEYTMFYFDCWCELIINIINIYRYRYAHLHIYLLIISYIRLIEIKRCNECIICFVVVTGA